MEEETKKYSVRILMQCGTTQQWITEVFEAEKFFVGTTGSGYYYFMVEGKQKYYPIVNTIVEEL